MANQSGDKLDKAVEILVKGIQEYECDFWSSPEQQVTEQEARDAAAKIIYELLFDEEGYPERVDGDVVERAILSVRNRVEEALLNKKRKRYTSLTKDK